MVQHVSGGLVLGPCHLSPDTVNQMGPQIYHYVPFRDGRILALGTLCDYIMAVIYHYNCFSGIGNCPHLPLLLFCKMSGFSTASMN